MQLIYRAHILHYTTRSTQPTRQPRAVNWRYKVSGEPTDNLSIRVLHSYEPRSVNWRFCV